MSAKKIETIEDLAEISGTAAAELGLKNKTKKVKTQAPKKQSKQSSSESFKNGGTLRAPETNKDREACEKAQKYLSSEWDSWPLPSDVEEANEHVALVWYIYEDAWPYDSDPDFSFYMCIPAYVFWGKKKRDKYLKAQKEELDKVYTKRRESLAMYGPNKDVDNG